jgi:hypothetical protein
MLGASAAQTPAGAGKPAPQPAAKATWVAPVKGQAEIGYLKPAVKVTGNEVVTTIKLKNISLGAIAGLRIDEFWYDAKGNMLPGDSQRLKKPLLPGEVVTIELRTPKQPNMNSNSYNFSHANGTIKPKLLKKLE